MLDIVKVLSDNPTMTSDSTTTAETTPEQCVELIVRALATIGGETEDDVRSAIATAEGLKRYDSIVLAEVLIAVESELGIQMPLDDNTARALRSVDTLAQAISEFTRGGR